MNCTIGMKKYCSACSRGRKIRANTRDTLLHAFRTISRWAPQSHRRGTASLWRGGSGGAGRSDCPQACTMGARHSLAPGARPPLPSSPAPLPSGRGHRKGDTEVTFVPEHTTERAKQRQFSDRNGCRFSRTDGAYQSSDLGRPRNCKQEEGKSVHTCPQHGRRGGRRRRMLALSGAAHRRRHVPKRISAAGGRLQSSRRRGPGRCYLTNRG